MERLEERQLLSGNLPAYDMDGWLSGIFDDGYHGDLDFDFSRDMATVDMSGSPVAVNEPRFAPEQLATETNLFTPMLTDMGGNEMIASGWDHDGETPLAVFIDRGPARVYFVRGDNFTIANVVQYTQNDLLSGAVAGYRYRPVTATVHEGLVVFFTERLRLEGANWIPEGVSFMYTQDLGATFQRVEQVGGGFDVPAIAGGVTDGMSRGNHWAFSNAFPEKSADDRLGAWFPWTDYLRKTSAVKGGQVGVFRAQREAVGSPWVVEPNVTVFEDWQTSDAGGLHAHSSGMFVDGLVSFWGDVRYRNRMVRHIASDLENYTTATWTQVTEFHGAWSPNDAKVYRTGNQGASTAPGPDFGEVLVMADLQPELVMKIQRPEDLSGSAIITMLTGSFPGPKSGSAFQGRYSTAIHYLPRRGYIATEIDTTGVPSIFGIHFSRDGEHWTSLLNQGQGRSYLYGDYVVQLSGGTLYGALIPDEVQVFSPLVVNPGNTNLLDSTWTTQKSPDAGNSIRRVEYVDGILVYSDTGLPLENQPVVLPPVMSSAPMYEVISSTNGNGLGNYEITQYASQSGENHWFTAWYYPLGTDGISPGVRLANNGETSRSAEWVANNEWVYGYTFGAPVPGSVGASEQLVRLNSGLEAGPRHYLMAVDGYVQGSSPTYPIAPGATGANELATLSGFEAGDAWSVGMVFALPEIPGFSSYFESLANGTYRPIATIYQDSENYVEIGFIRVSGFTARLELNIYAGGAFANSMTISGFRWDILDRAELVVSASADGYGATLLMPREGYGVHSTTISTAPLIHPVEIRLSSADQSVVSPMEWFAIHVNPDTALTTAQRELLITTVDMLTTPNALPGDYNYDGSVDILDYNLFTSLYIPPDAVFAVGDYNQDLHVNGADRVVWEETYGSEEDLRADGNNNGVIDDEDYDIWLANREPAMPGDYSDDGKINQLDHDLWVNTFGSTTDLRADGNEDGKISAADYTIWRNHVPFPVLLPDGNGNGFLDDGDYYVWLNNVGGVKTPPLKAGDYNRDGLVTPADYDVWLNTYMGTINLAADGNHNGRIDLGDYTVWADAYGIGGQGSSAGFVSQHQESESPELASTSEPLSAPLEKTGADTFQRSAFLSRRRGIENHSRRRGPDPAEFEITRDLLATAVGRWNSDRPSDSLELSSTVDKEEDTACAVDALFERMELGTKGLGNFRFRWTR